MLLMRTDAGQDMPSGVDHDKLAAVEDSTVLDVMLGVKAVGNVCT